MARSLSPESVLQCNVDVAIFVDGAGYGAVIRDHDDMFVAIRSGRLMCGQKSYVAEVRAIKEALA